MPALWDSKVTFVSVSQFLRLVLCSPFGSVSEPFLTPRLIVSLGGRKKKGKKDRGKKKKSLLLTLNPFSEFCQSSWMPQEEGGLGFAFLPYYGGRRSGPQYSQLPRLWPRS